MQIFFCKKWYLCPLKSVRGPYQVQPVSPSLISIRATVRATVAKHEQDVPLERGTATSHIH